ncbi:unnamed protein product [Allacma fusca]|uniref:Uncharacterized protein n=2 Tax=Allacma fusca TaxID=39272 RepID=A0A8J2LIV6_9HEXA|nr:unnamed protein product [Allacma fusca]
MKDGQLCGARTGLWTKVIGWFEVIGTLASIIILTIALFADPQKDGEVTFDLPRRNNMIMSLILLLAILSFIMGIFLLRGSYKDSSAQIRGWIVFTIISLVLLGVVTIVAILIKSDVILIVSMGCSMVVQGFCLWIVNFHKKHIEASSFSLPVKV